MALSLSTLKPAKGSRQRKVRVGRGESSGLGKTSGRGGKGQTARTGGKVRAGFEGGQMPLYRRIGKLGFRSRQAAKGLNQFTVLSLDMLEKFDNGAVVDSESLAKIGLSLKAKTKAGYKVLGTGTLTKKLTVKVAAISASAKAKIESCGGSVELLEKVVAE